MVSRRTIRSRGKFVLGQQGDRLSQLYGQAEGRYEGALDAVRQGDAAAKAEIGAVSRNAYQRTGDMFKQARGNLAAGATARGLSNTTAPMSGLLQTVGHESRAYADIDRNLAGLRSSLASQSGMREAQGLHALGDLSTQRFGAESATYYDPWFNLMTQGGGEGFDWGGLIQAGATVAGGIFGGPPGAAAANAGAGAVLDNQTGTQM